MPGITFDITTDGPAQKTGTRWRAQRKGSTDAPFVVAQTVSFSDGDGPHKGLYQTRILNEIPALRYDRQASQAFLGLWAHFIWPTVVAESGGHHLLFNTYDRARFTFGFYQLAAHTPGDNLILLFRELLALPTAASYFPDLSLKSGKVQRTDGATTFSLEAVTAVHRPNGKVENQLFSFMTFLNPNTLEAGPTEALNAAKLMHWLLNDPKAVEASVRVAVGIMKGKIAAAAAAFKLRGKDPRLAIWVSDIRHQGRGGSDAIRAALAKPTLADQLTALSLIGSGNKDYDGRRKTVKDRIADLQAEGVFAGVTLGDTKLPL